MRSTIGIIKRNEDNYLENYVKAVNKFGANALLIDNTLNEKTIFDMIKNCDGIIFTGGSSWEVVDELMLEYCLNNKIPFLGICLGMQMIGNYFSDDHEYGVDKTVKIDSKINHNVSKNYAHKVILKDGLLSELFNDKVFLVNSYHNYCIKSANENIIKGYSYDGVIETLEVPNHPFGVGVQWHPEKMIDYDDNSRRLLKKFVYKSNETKKYHY